MSEQDPPVELVGDREHRLVHLRVLNPDCQSYHHVAVLTIEQARAHRRELNDILASFLADGAE